MGCAHAHGRPAGLLRQCGHLEHLPPNDPPHRLGKKDPCGWKTEDLSLLLRPPGALAPFPRKGGGSFFGGLYDSGGLRTVLSRHLGVLYAHDAAKSKVAPKSVRYATPIEEDLATAKRTLSPCKR
ncbi:hypothetical protein [Pyxidicoccus xibeiensis]|uniref:hypothetical protein n=1 Tax=Pyxidicoccus xibeiensis TaxID=2906759 RepID=UPI0020A7E659|nr:hypothetical protein [Pyxidicoccus xibeiensis]MCP3139022.1 hypothetical protein [Pyxidicoccus xibeiensis]